MILLIIAGTIIGLVLGFYILFVGRKELWATLGIVALSAAANLLAVLVLDLENGRELIAAQQWIFVGIAVGLMAGIVFFIVNYSRVNIIKHELSGVLYHSTVDRSDQQHRLLRENGEHLSILKLQGFIFFGTANRLLEHIHRRIDVVKVALPRRRGAPSTTSSWISVAV